MTKALGDGVDAESAEQLLVTVRSWASGLDQTTYEARQAEDGICVQSTLPDGIAAAMQHNSGELQRAGDVIRRLVRYLEPRKGTARPLNAEDLTKDLAVARELLGQPA